MNVAVTITPDALKPPQPAGMGAGLVLALLAHALLMVALTFGVRWKSSEPVGIEAELWAAVPTIAAPRAAAPEPAPPPRPAEPAPAPPPPPKPPEPAVKAEPPPAPVIDAQIAIEKAKREEEAKNEAARVAQAERKQAKLDAEKLEQARKEKAKREAAQREAEAKKEADKREQAQRDKVAKDAKEKEAREKSAQAAKAKKDAQDLADQREANLKRIQGQAGATGAPTDRGTAARTAGPSSGYAGRIKARIQPNIVFTDSLDNNPTATVEVRLAPDGRIVSSQLIKSSGVKAWDDAVLRAIEKTESLPRDTDGRVPSLMEISFRPRD